MHFTSLFTVDNLISFLKHVSMFRVYLGDHARDNENLQIAREVLMDSLDSSCVDLSRFCEVLEEIRAEVKHTAGPSTFISINPYN